MQRETNSQKNATNFLKKIKNQTLRTPFGAQHVIERNLQKTGIIVTLLEQLADN